jgi:ribosomal 50S subunit-associated protein YjgA (DUF615 family)
MATQLTQAQVDISWKEFEASYDFEKKFGLDALQQTLNAQRTGQGLSNVNQKFVLDALGQLNMSGLQKDIEAHLDGMLEKAHLFRQENMTPRAEQKSEEVNKDIVEQDLSRSNLAMPPWPNADKLDLAAAPSIRNAAKALAETKQPAEFTTAYNSLKDALKNELKNDYKMRMSMRASPKRGVDTPRAG